MKQKYALSEHEQTSAIKNRQNVTKFNTWSEEKVEKIWELSGRRKTNKSNEEKVENIRKLEDQLKSSSIRSPGVADKRTAK